MLCGLYPEGLYPSGLYPSGLYPRIIEEVPKINFVYPLRVSINQKVHTVSIAGNINLANLSAQVRTVAIDGKQYTVSVSPNNRTVTFNDV